MTQATLILRAGQHTALTPRLQQSVRLLQLSSNEFVQEVALALTNNPFLDEGNLEDSLDDPDVDAGSFGDQALDGAAMLSASTGEAPVDPLPYSELQVDDGGLEHALNAPFPESSFTQSSGAGSLDLDVGAWAEAVPSLRDHLNRELIGCRLDSRTRAIAEIVIEALDDDGYLRQDIADLLEGFDFDPPATTDEAAAGLSFVQQLGPPGIAARTVRECLMLQLQAREADAPSSDRIALAIVDQSLDLLARRDWSGLARRVGCSVDAVHDAADCIRSLEPRPGSAFGGTVSHAVVPDVIVRRSRDGWVADTNPAVVPRVCLNRVYAELFHDSREGERQPLGQQLQEARWLVRNAAQRFVTIRRVARAIVAEQTAFFEYGDIAIKPLSLRQIAEQLGLHESTISRAAGNKFMATPRGTFEFKHFFSRRLATVSGGSCSAASIRAAMREMIDGEVIAEPLSDVDLARMLTDQGLCVARRTVSKYRGLLKIPPAELRRRL